MSDTADDEIERIYERGRLDLAREVFALHEDTVEKYHEVAERDKEGKEGAFARGRIVEAKSIAKAIQAILPYFDGKELAKGKGLRQAQAGEEVTLNTR